MQNDAPCVVTGYVPAGGSHRDNLTYLELGQRLLDIGLPTLAFLDASVAIELPRTASRIGTSLDVCWLAPHMAGLKAPPSDNPGKDTATYLAIMNQKARWVADALDHSPASHFIWLDFGILHIPGASTASVEAFHQRARLAVADRGIDRIAMAAIWKLHSESVIDFNRPNWFFAGGAFVVPRRLARWFAETTEQRLLEHMRQTGQLTWEINIWAAVAQSHPQYFTAWYCDHNHLLFDNAFAQHRA